MEEIDEVMSGKEKMISEAFDTLYSMAMDRSTDKTRWLVIAAGNILHAELKIKD